MKIGITLHLIDPHVNFEQCTFSVNVTYLDYDLKAKDLNTSICQRPQQEKAV